MDGFHRVAGQLNSVRLGLPLFFGLSWTHLVQMGLVASIQKTTPSTPADGGTCLSAADRAFQISRFDE